MKITEGQFEKDMIEYVDRMKELISADMWQNMLLDCSKNELFVLWLLYRKKEVNMTQIAEYIHAPLNTTTGIISRMEKKNLIIRQRSLEDKRVVTICMGEQGKAQMQAVIEEFLFYGKRVVAEFNEEEMKLLFTILDKLTVIMSEDRKKERLKTKVRKIMIE